MEQKPYVTLEDVAKFKLLGKNRFRDRKVRRTLSFHWQFSK